jgi:hypothetical protein
MAAPPVAVPDSQKLASTREVVRVVDAVATVRVGAP